MSIQLTNDIPLKSSAHDGPLMPQAVALLDSGHLVAFCVNTQPTQATTLALVGHAWLVDDEGDLQAVMARPVATAFSFNMDVSLIGSMGVQVAATAVRDLLLGEAVNAPVDWSRQVIEQVSIRNVIAVAEAVGTPIDWR